MDLIIHKLNFEYSLARTIFISDFLKSLVSYFFFFTVPFSLE